MLDQASQRPGSPAAPRCSRLRLQLWSVGGVGELRDYFATDCKSDRRTRSTVSIYRIKGGVRRDYSSDAMAFHGGEANENSWTEVPNESVSCRARRASVAFATPGFLREIYGILRGVLRDAGRIRRRSRVCPWAMQGCARRMGLGQGWRFWVGFVGVGATSRRRQKYGSPVWDPQIGNS